MRKLHELQAGALILTERGSGKSGMPVLYYKANISNTLHDFTKPTNSTYNYEDNDELVQLEIPWNPDIAHPMSGDTSGTTSSGGSPTPEIFYDNTLNEKIITKDRPYRADSYILLSAGFDGEYGTPDDVYNFGD